jgi:uncharacterized protein (UPF0332 family)
LSKTVSGFENRSTHGQGWYSPASARVLLEAGDTDGTANRAYYAMFDAAMAALLWVSKSGVGNLPKTHTGLITHFSLNLVKAGHLPAALGRSLNHVEDLRLTADYLAEPLPKDQAEIALLDATAFVEAIRLLVARPL